MSMNKFLVLLLLASLAVSAVAGPVVIGTSIPAQSVISAATATKSLDAVHAAGISRVKIFVDWARVQPNAETWNFASLDAAVHAARERSLDIVLVPGPAPRWAVTYLGKNPGVEEIRRARPDLPAYRTFMQALAKRYAERIAYYQLWDRPTASNLLVNPVEVFELYREGAKAVHGVNPSLKVVAAEPADVNLSWIADYLKGAQGASRADVISLSPIRPWFSPERFAWHIQTLQERVLPKTNPPALWADIPVESSGNQAYALGAIALLRGVYDLFLVEACEGGNIPIGETVNSVAAFFTPLNGLTYSGWSHSATGIVGTFTGGTQKVTLVYPLADGTLQLVPTGETTASAITATDTLISVLTPNQSSSLIAITAPVAVQEKTGIPEAFIGAQSTATAPGLPDFRPTPITDQEVSLDLSGTNPHRIIPMRELPGGHYYDFELFDRHILSTVKDTNPWIHFDIPDGFLFFNIERVPVEVTVVVYGAYTREKCGFNLYYDAVGGMRNTPWQWIDVGSRDIFTYKFRIDDAIFASREGYDIRINMGGSDENVRILGFSVRKLQ